MSNLNPDWQDLLQSTQFWSVVVAAASIVAKQFGLAVPADGLANDIVAAIGALTTVFAQVKSGKSIKSVAGVPVNKDRPDHPDNRGSGLGQ